LPVPDTPLGTPFDRRWTWLGHRWTVARPPLDRGSATAGPWLGTARPPLVIAGHTATRAREGARLRRRRSL